MSPRRRSQGRCAIISTDSRRYALPLTPQDLTTQAYNVTYTSLSPEGKIILTTQASSLHPLPLPMLTAVVGSRTPPMYEKPIRGTDLGLHTGKSSD